MTDGTKDLRGGGPRVTAAMSIAGALLFAVGAYVWWSHRPSRPYVVVGRHELSKAELDRFARSRMEDAKNRGMITPGQMLNPEVTEKYRREAAQMWVFRTVLLDEALRLKMKASPADEKRYRDSLESALRRHKLGSTVEDWFKSGVLPEKELRERYREDILVDMLLRENVVKAIPRPTAEEVDRLFQERRRTGAVSATRASVSEAISRERYREALCEYYMKLLQSADVHPAGLVPTEVPPEGIGTPVLQ